MNNILPFIAIALAVTALVLSPPPEPKEGKPKLVAAALLALLALVAGYLYRNDYVNVLPSAIAFAVGVVAVAVCRVVEDYRSGSGAAAAGIAAGLAAFCHWADPSYLVAVRLGLIVGLALGAWCVNGFSEGRFSLPLSTALFAAAFVAGDFMGSKALDSEPGAHFGSGIGLAIAISGLIGILTSLKDKRRDGSLSFLSGWLAIFLLLVFGYVVGGRYLESKEAWIIFDGAVVAGAILHWTIRPQGKDDSLAFLIAAVIWIGIATLAFSYLKGFGMTIALCGAVASLLVLGNTRALLSAGPLLGLVFYRVLREAYPETTRALDIGQHYAVIGLAFGLVLALLPADWVRPRATSSVKFEIARAVWGITLALLPVGLAVVLGAKGMVGFVAGLGFAALIDGIRASRTPLTLVLAAGLASLTTLAYGWLTNLLDMTREDKQTAFYWIGGVGLFLAIAIAVLSKVEAEPDPQLS